MNSFQTTLTPNPKKLYKFRSVIKQDKNMNLNTLSKCFQVPVPVVWKLLIKCSIWCVKAHPTLKWGYKGLLDNIYI